MTKENINGYIRHFAAFSGSRYAGSLILRLHYIRRKRVTDNIFSTSILTDHARFQTLAVQGWNGSQLAGKLTMELFFPKRNGTDDAGQPSPDRHVPIAKIPDAASSWRYFTAAEVREFSRRTGDTNPLHLGTKPIVQGLFIWQQLFLKLGEPVELHLAFQQPLCAGDVVYLCQEPWEKRYWKSCCGRQQPVPAETYTLYQGYTTAGIRLFTLVYRTEEREVSHEG